MVYDLIQTETLAPGVGLVRLNRPDALNALNKGLVTEMLSALKAYDADPAIGCIILTGSAKVFAAGADIKEMADQSAVEMYMGASLVDGLDFSGIGKPIIAAVSGYALGGGCEIAMMCDIIVASETAVFGQPEIALGILPGAGGTQRLTRAVGKSLAMEMMLADRRLSAAEALQFGLVSRVVAPEVLLEETLKIAQKIAGMSQVAVKLTKEAVNKAYEMTLQEGLEYEQRNFYIAFSTEDKAEGMRAFIDKRSPNWQNR